MSIDVLQSANDANARVVVNTIGGRLSSTRKVSQSSKDEFGRSCSIICSAICTLSKDTTAWNDLPVEVPLHHLCTPSV